MPFIETEGARIHVRSDGPPDAPAVLLVHSLGADLSMWDAQAGAFADQLRVVRYDLRGHGASTGAPPLSLDDLGADALRLLDALGLWRVHVCGVSLGGMIGMWLGARAPERVGRLVLANTSAFMERKDAWDARMKTVRAEGMAAAWPEVAARWFTPEFSAENASDVERLGRVFGATNPQTYAGCCAAIRDMDLRPVLARIAAPSLVISGAQDAATPPADAAVITRGITGAAHESLAAAHLSNVERPAAFTRAVLRFLGRHDEGQRYDDGLRVRRSVLGDAHVDRTLAARNEFNDDFQDFITRYAWGEVWARPGLPRQTRSLVTIAMLIALDRPDELRMHVRAALRNGVTRDELKELLLHAGLYCGLPAANAAYHLVETVLTESEASHRG